MEWWQILICVGAALIGIVIGYFIRRTLGERKISSAEAEAKRIVDEGIKTAETKKKEALLEAKEEIIKARNESEAEIKERRNEVAKLERRCVSREESLERKLELLEKKEDALSKKIKDNEDKAAEIEKLRAEQFDKLQLISGYTVEEAKKEIVDGIIDVARFEAAQKVVEIQNRAKEEADEVARNIICMAIQRVASEQVAESTVSVVPLPNDDMKGRIIGREGRNIRAVEQQTGVDLIIDDTPEAISISCFDPVRRAIAKLSLEKLIQDGRIHPAKIEETVEKAKKEIENSIKQAGERAIFEVGVHGINNELVKILGRLKYRTSYGQNVLNHSVEVAYISGMIADELGADSTLARRAGLLHDIGKAMTQEVEGSHVQIGVDIAKKFKENKDVVHAIEAHHGDVEPKTLVAMIVQAADAISAARPGARREDIENYIKRLTKLEEVANGFDGVDTAYAIQAGREIRVIVKPEVISDEQMVLLASDIARKLESDLVYPGQIKVNIIREKRATDYAK